MARGYKEQGNPLGPLYLITAVLSLGLSIAILVIVNQDLWNLSYACSWSSWWYNSCVTLTDRCYMQTQSSQDTINMCYYSWAASGLGIFFALWLFFMQLCSGRHRHIPCFEVVCCLLALLWWIGFAASATVYGQNADDASINSGSSSNTSYNAADAQLLYDKKGYRTAVWAMGWANVGLWAICLLASMYDCCSYRKSKPQDTPAYPTGAYVSTQPGYGAPAYQQPPPGAYYAAPAPAGYPAAPPPGYPPAAPAGYPPQQAYQPSPFSST